MARFCVLSCRTLASLYIKEYCPIGLTSGRCTLGRSFNGKLSGNIENCFSTMSMTMPTTRDRSAISTRTTGTSSTSRSNVRPIEIPNIATFVPNCEPSSLAIDQTKFEELQDFITNSKRLFILTGAGISTESGIPDYRSDGVGLYARSDSRPIQYMDFLRSASRRKRYWARNYIGWPRFSSFEPNIAHWMLSEWETAGKIHWLVTQNVDSLHTKANSTRLTELHGCSARIICLSCQQVSTRTELQTRMKEINPDFENESQDIAPDGDVILPDDLVEGFNVPPCQNCGGILKPNLVFYGDNVPRPIVQSVFTYLSQSDAMLVAGSSLEVYSGYRFALAAREQKKPLAIVNIGPTRADKLATLKMDARLGSILPCIDLT